MESPNSGWTIYKILTLDQNQPLQKESGSCGDSSFNYSQKLKSGMSYFRQPAAYSRERGPKMLPVKSARHDIVTGLSGKASSDQQMS